MEGGWPLQADNTLVLRSVEPVVERSMPPKSV